MFNNMGIETGKRPGMCLLNTHKQMSKFRNVYNETTNLLIVVILEEGGTETFLYNFSLFENFTNMYNL